MAWDSTRPVPWNRLIREWLIYAAIMTAVFALFFRGDNVVGAIAGVLLSGPLYLAFGAVMAKFGYSRTRMKNLRGVRQERKDKEAASKSSSSESDSSESEDARSRPAPTSRTSGGSNRPRSTSKRKR